ncbi:MAG: type II toxin-antitoxin system VapC family toxin [Acidobacteria bacterium]|nr:type II toxin-antitoxin system VapC family toxin [Acidobacteriota bacterium]
MIVVDTNAITYLFLKMAETSTAVLVREKDPEWTAPALWRSEFRNVLMRYVRNCDLDVDKAIEAVRRANRIVRSRPVSSKRVLQLSAASGCTAYDCEFVSLAERLNVPLVTNDKQVLNAFPTIAVSLTDFIAR